MQNEKTPNPAKTCVLKILHEIAAVNLSRIWKAQRNYVNQTTAILIGIELGAKQIIRN